ncbi:MAG TPA: hypothetical protein VGG75_14795 [Trebonia sp.]
MATKRGGGMGALLAKQRELAAEDARAAAAVASASAPAQTSALRLLTVDDVPEPHDPSSDGPLTAAEEAELRACEFALDNARLAFTAAGKALATVQQAKLYRPGFGSFESYVEDRWGISRAHAYRWIAAWPLAGKLAPLADRAVTENHVRELLPLANVHGDDAAVTAYQVVSETDGVRVTAALLRDIAALLADDYDPETAADTIRDWLATRQDPAATATPDPVQVITTDLDRVAKRISRLGKSDPQAAREALALARADLDQVEQSLP